MTNEIGAGADGGSAARPATDAPRRFDSTAGAWRSGRAWTVLLISVLASLGVDLATKHLAFERLGPRPVEVKRAEVLNAGREDPRLIGELIPVDCRRPVTVIPDVLDLTLVLNPGALFGMGAGRRWFFVVFTAAALLFGLWIFRNWTSPRDDVAHAALGLMIGGGIGNLYDRLAYACVRDFLHPLPGWRWPAGWRPFGGNGEIWPYVSNGADLFLLVGIGVLMWKLWRGSGGERAAATREASHAATTPSTAGNRGQDGEPSGAAELGEQA